MRTKDGISTRGGDLRVRGKSSWRGGKGNNSGGDDKRGERGGWTLIKNKSIKITSVSWSG